MRRLAHGWLLFALACGQGAEPAAAPPSAPANPPPRLQQEAPVPATEESPSPAVAPAPATEAPAAVGFLGEDERPILDALRAGQIASIEKGRGGRSLGFKITLDNGTVGYFKPEQSFSGAHWYAEIASYYLDRALGLGRTPPTVSRRFTWSRLRTVAEPDERIAEIRVLEDGTVRGALIAWVNGPIPPAALPPGWEEWVRIVPPVGVSPYQRSAAIRDELHAQDHAAARNPEPPAPDTPDRAAELSDLILFDYLTANIDRWSGDRTNVRTRGFGGPVFFLDNGAGFAHGQARTGYLDAQLSALQRFRASTVTAIERFDVTRFAQALSADPEGPILTPDLLDGLAVRRAAVLEHIRRQRERFGERAVMRDASAPSATRAQLVPSPEVRP